MAKSSNTGTILLLGGAGIALYYAYTQGWLSSLFGSSATSAPAPTSPASSQPVASAPATPAAPATSPLTPVVLPPGFMLQAAGAVPSAGSTQAANIAANTQPCASLTPGSTGAQRAAALLSAGYTQAQVNALLCPQAPVGSIAGLGRVAILLPRAGRVLVLPRNYRWRRAA